MEEGFKEKTIEIKLNPFKKLDEDEQELIKKAAEYYGKFLNKDVNILAGHGVT